MADQRLVRGVLLEASMASRQAKCDSKESEKRRGGMACKMASMSVGTASSAAAAR